MNSGADLEEGEESEVPPAERLRILFLNAPYTTGDSRYFSTHVPLGQFHIASGLEGYDIRMVNCHELLPEQLAGLLAEFRPDHIGITLYAALLRETKKLVAFLRSHSPALISIGGAMATISPAASLYQTKADLIFRGEAEKTFKAAMECIGSMKDFRRHDPVMQRLKEIEGLAFFDESGSFVMPSSRIPRLSAEELEEGELKYPLLAGLIRSDRIMQLSTSRGCPNNCVFCSKIHGNTWRGWSAAKIVRELARIGASVEKGDLPPVEVIAFEDDDFVCNRGRVLELSRSVADARFSCHFIIQTNPDTLLRDGEPDRELLDALRKMRTKMIYLGTDSLQRQELRRLGKPLDDVEKIRDLSRELYKREILTSHYMILSNLDTTAADFLENIYTAAQFSLHFNQSFYMNFSLIPVVGSRFFRRVVEEKVPYAFVVEPAEGHAEFNYPVGAPVDPLDPLLQDFYAAFHRKKGLDRNDPLVLFSAFGDFITEKYARAENGKHGIHGREALGELHKAYREMSAQLALIPHVLPY